MKIWLLEYWDSDSNAYLFEKLCKDRDSVYNYLLDNYSNTEFSDEECVQDGIEIIEFNNLRYFKPRDQRSRYYRSDFLATLQEVQ
jgi:hypothetical protein